MHCFDSREYRTDRIDIYLTADLNQHNYLLLTGLASTNGTPYTNHNSDICTREKETEAGRQYVCRLYQPKQRPKQRIQLGLRLHPS